MTTTTTAATHPESWMTSTLVLFIPLLFVMFLGFIDEGHYNFRWMEDPGNWVALGLYWLAMILGEFLVALVIPRRLGKRTKVWLTIGLGMPLGVLLMVGFWVCVTGFIHL